MLHALTALLTEFFSANVTNERKREIETLLSDFGRQEGSWKQCLYFLTHTNDQYVMMFCLNALEEAIGRRWLRMLAEHKAEIRNGVQGFLLARHKEVPTFVRNKLCKLVVDMGRLDWPHFYPTFYSSILQLCQSSETCLTGLVLLKTASEELACPRDDLSVSRKVELRRLLLDQVPATLNVVAGILDSVLEKQRHLVTATPPPSPTHGQSVTNSSPLQQGNALSSMWSALHKSHLECLEPEARVVCIHALSCLDHLLSWIPLEHCSSSLLNTLFTFASFGCTQEKTEDSELGERAMGCINEILSKNCVPTDLEDFLMLICHNTFYLLQVLTKRDCGGTPPASSKLAGLTDVYLDKFTEFLRLFVTFHVHRFEDNIPVFLALLFEYTFQQPVVERYFTCLDIWAVFLDFLTNKRNKDMMLHKYRDVLLTLVHEILKKSLFKFNQSSLEELDDEALDDSLQTEWQCFLQHNLNIITKIAEIIPHDVHAQVLTLFEKELAVYLELEKFVDGSTLRVVAENDCRRLHCSLRDLSSLLQAVGSLGENASTTYNTVSKICHTASYSSRMRFYDMKTAAPSVLQWDLIEVHAQLLAALKAFSHWLSQCHTECLQNGARKDEFTTLVGGYVDAALPCIQRESPEKVTHSAAHLLLSLTLVRPSFLFSLPLMQQFFVAVCDHTQRPLPPQAELLVLRSLHNMVVLPWPSTCDASQEWDTRATHHRRLVASVTRVLSQITAAPQFATNQQLQLQTRPSVKWMVAVVHDLVDSLQGTSTRTKQLCHQGWSDVFNGILALFPIYLNDKDMTEGILDVLLSMFRVLQPQLGVAFVERMLQTFLNLFTRDQLQECIIKEGSAGIRVVEKFISILQEVVQEPSSAFKAFLPRIIDLCMDEIYPIVAERPSPEVKQSLFELVEHFLLHNWRYFFTGALLSEQTLNHREQFVKLMQAYGQSFLQPDINVFRHNLNALESLNRKWKLYHKAPFRDGMLPQFVQVLLQCLATRSHDLLREEIHLVLHNMAAVNLDTFYASLLPAFIASCQGIDQNQKRTLTESLKREPDLPSFTQSLQNLINDLRYYHMCNNSL
ncbi:exportin-6-like isoform X2 [Ornithodoros turicata]